MRISRMAMALSALFVSAVQAEGPVPAEVGVPHHAPESVFAPSPAVRPSCPPCQSFIHYQPEPYAITLFPNDLFRSDHEFSDFVEPVTNPILFEDPRSMTRVRFDFINQEIPGNSVLRGGDAQVYAMQATVALSNRLTLLANRDGYIDFNPNALPDENGWADIGTGLKYVIIRDECNRFLLSGGFLYEWSHGSNDVFQGNGDGVWNFFLTTGKGFGKNHFIGTVGWELPNNGSAESESIFYSLHLDREIADGIYVLTEFTGIEYVESGRAIPGLNMEGGDLFNLGAGNVAGNHFASWAVGGAWKPNRHVSIGAAYEIPVTNRKDLMDNRVTANLTLFY